MNTPLRIFLSYGHDANEELVRRIYADLKQRGHDVWFDKHDITFGDDWRRSITSGITECDRFLSFLSKHSTRDPGVCLDEIRIAIGAKGGNIQSILVESEQEVKLPPSISHIQWLDMHDWQERRASGEAAWEKWYQEKLAEIIRVVESDESRKFAGEIRTLEEYLKPVVSDFAADARIQKLLEKKLTGRAWLFEAVEKWRTTADRSSRIFWMMGAPGFGKSFFAAHLAHFYGRGTVIGVHFCAYDKPDHRSAPRIIRTLAFQLATRLPDFRKLLLTLPEIAELDKPGRKNTAAGLFDYLLANPLKLSITGGRERLLIVIDALDEAGSASAQGGDGRNELVEMLARHAPSLPDWIGLVVTSRPESDVRAPLQGLNPFVLDTATEANRADLREYLRHELAPQLQPRPDANRLVEQILEKSEGVFLYAERFCDDVQRGQLSLDRPAQFPQGLGGIFFQWFQRQFPGLEKFRKEVRPVLRAILAAREPLPVEILQRLFNWQDEELRDFTRPLGSLFPVSGGAGHRVIKPYHKSIADWLVAEAKAGAYFVSVKEGHRMLRDFGRRSWTQVDFALAHFPAHLAQCGDWGEVSSLLINDAFIQAKRLRLGYDLLSLDYQWAEECLAALTTDYDRGLFIRVRDTAKSLAGFSGRIAEVAQVEEFLRSSRCQQLVIVGMGGIGKTLLLKHVWFGDIRSRVFIGLEHATRTRDSGLIGFIVASVFDQLLGRAPNPTEKAAGTRSFSELSSRIQCVLVDNLDEIGNDGDVAVRELMQCGLKTVWATRGSEHVIREFGKDVEFLKLGSLSLIEAFEYFEKVGAVQSENAAVNARELVEELGGLPLALALAGAYMKRHGCTIEDYLTQFRKAETELSSGTGDTSARLLGSFRKALNCFSASEQMRLAELCIAADDESVNVAVVQQLWRVSGNLDELDTTDLLSRFNNHKLIRIDDDGQQRKVVIHKLVKQFVRKLNLSS